MSAVDARGDTDAELAGATPLADARAVAGATDPGVALRADSAAAAASTEAEDPSAVNLFDEPDTEARARKYTTTKATESPARHRRSPRSRPSFPRTQ
jgi:hypothetical protein